ncbi:MAG: AAA family ATPase [Alphaproteobacteria bacterium]|nr:AAA family ATPase [Alphaproteobacteria bacterium]
MALFLAVSNRKGGVGKSTISTMLAYSFAVWSKKKVMLIDLDAQSNSSLILLGGEKWIEAQKTSRNVAAYIEDRLYSIEQAKIPEYTIQGVGDVVCDDGTPPPLSLLPGSLNFEDMQDELITFYSRNQTPYQQARNKCAEHSRAAFSFARRHADIVIMDCAPGLSNATHAALKLAHKVVVPFRPDAVSAFAVNRISTIIEGQSFDSVQEIPHAKRRYMCLANYVRPGGRDTIYVDEIAHDHPMLETQVPAMPDVADAFDFLLEPMPIEEKFGAAAPILRALHDELTVKIGIE